MKTVITAAFVALSFSLTSCNKNSKSQTSTVSDSAEYARASKNSHPADPANAPVIKFEKDSYDFGKITEGDKVTHDFQFTNVGKTPLIISLATATCGCTTPEYPKKPIAPGEKGEIKVTFNSAGKSGMQRKVITINSNAEPTISEVFLIGEVESKK